MMIAAIFGHPGHGGVSTQSSWHYLIDHDFLVVLLCTVLALAFVRSMWRSR
ncbi:MAG TPA: hypothetical protein VML75_04095 [Kofleriaceae bacterium]|nr:hypothetical protein [Kofleriaceae bacterium]